MLVCMFKSHLQTLIIKHQTLPNLNHCLTRPIFRSYSPKRTIDSSEFKISFLKNKCGLSGKHLIRASKCVHFDSSDHRPDSVLELFRNFGFPQPNITRIVSVVPRILQSLKPLYWCCRFMSPVISEILRSGFMLNTYLRHLVQSFSVCFLYWFYDFS